MENARVRLLRTISVCSIRKRSSKSSELASESSDTIQRVDN